jgi:ABC-type uncharacterized transport system substrate-binding protein
MKRRNFITVLGGTVAAWPIASRAQKPRKWRVGFLHPGESSVIVSTRIDGFRDGLGAPGGDVEIVVRLANEQLDKLPAMAVELVDQNVEAICAVSPPAVLAARAATRSIPIIALDLESDPVANGWVASLAHPGVTSRASSLTSRASTRNRYNSFAKPSPHWRRPQCCGTRRAAVSN